MDQAIANRFYEYRKKSGLSQEELAARLGISRQSVSKWERGDLKNITTPPMAPCTG